MGVKTLISVFVTIYKYASGLVSGITSVVYNGIVSPSYQLPEFTCKVWAVLTFKVGSIHTVHVVFRYVSFLHTHSAASPHLLYGPHWAAVVL